jgi:hypothetical protein
MPAINEISGPALTVMFMACSSSEARGRARHHVTAAGARGA